MQLGDGHCIADLETKTIFLVRISQQIVHDEGQKSMRHTQMNTPTNTPTNALTNAPTNKTTDKDYIKSTAQLFFQFYPKIV